MPITPRINRAIILIALAFLGLHSQLTVAMGDKPQRPDVRYERVFPKLSFSNPTRLLQQPGDSSHWYLLEKSGKIFVFDNDPAVARKQVFLDISDDRVDESFEGGLLGMAFDPHFDKNRYVYLSYTTSENPEADSSEKLTSRISRFTVNEDGTAIDGNSEVVVFTLDQPWNNHNGGHILFGPDGYLYAGFGDGGSWGDPNNNAQNTHTLLGTILRIDVNRLNTNQVRARKYGIPPDNPFADSPDCGKGRGCPEIYAWGLRNPWRWSFDRQTGQLWVGDVGQGKWEEIDLVEKGKNYGWRCYEGLSEYNFENCDDDTKYQKPLYVYEHMPYEKSRDGMAGSVTGGYVYRGSKVPTLYGDYLFADYVHGIIWMAEQPYMRPTEAQQLFDTDLMIVSFAEDNDGELYFLSYSEKGGIYQFVSTKTDATP
ncbi:MAG: PQQ-dependent sugar dehydrogenase [Gammaproteobacteria bacterium]